MFGRAYNICHVKAMELGEKGKPFYVDMAKTFGILKDANYKGYCSMEFDSPGDPYKGTAELIETTLKYLIAVNLATMLTPNGRCPSQEACS